MYLEASQAVQKLKRRRENLALKQKVLDFLGGTLPTGMPDKPLACITRHIASCRNEDLAFADLAIGLGLEPWWPEYLQDHFTTMNPDKVAYVHLKVFRPNNIKKIKLIKNLNPIDQLKSPLSEIVIQQNGHTQIPENLVAIHHLLRTIAIPCISENYCDISPWLHMQAIRFGATQGQKSIAHHYYPAELALFVAHGILFEDFHSGPNAQNLDRFRRNCLEPALAVVKQNIGLDPLIVQLPWEEHYKYYPETILPAFASKTM